MCVQRIKVSDQEIEPWRQQNLYGGRARGQQDNADMIILPCYLIGRKRPFFFLLVCLISPTVDVQINVSRCIFFLSSLLLHSAESELSSLLPSVG